MNYKLITGLVIVCLIVIFFIQNAAVVEIKIFFWTVSMSRILLMFILLAIGILAGWLSSSYSTRRKSNKK